MLSPIEDIQECSEALPLIFFDASLDASINPRQSCKGLLPNANEIGSGERVDSPAYSRYGPKEITVTYSAGN